MSTDPLRDHRISPQAAGATRRPQASVTSRGSLQGTWPHSLSHAPLLKVSDVLRLVKPEFPTLSTSKLRFLDAHGLVSPHRTAAGYRQYSPADVERLRFVLRQQRDHYRPLSVIADYLQALDTGRMQEPVAPHALADVEAEYLTGTQVAQRAGVDLALIEQLDGEGLIQQPVPGRYHRDVMAVVVAAHTYLSAGGDMRSLRTLRNAAERASDHANTASSSIRAKGSGAEADALALEHAEASIAAFSAFVRSSLDRSQH